MIVAFLFFLKEVFITTPGTKNKSNSFKNDEFYIPYKAADHHTEEGSVLLSMPLLSHLNEHLINYSSMLQAWSYKCVKI